MPPPSSPPDTFSEMSTEALADIWYSLAGAEIRHPGRFTSLVEASNRALFARLGDDVAAFIDERFRQLRVTDAAEDAVANAIATESAQS